MEDKKKAAKNLSSQDIIELNDDDLTMVTGGSFDLNQYLDKHGPITSSKVSTTEKKYPYGTRETDITSIRFQDGYSTRQVEHQWIKPTTETTKSPSA
jgi:hypothetical protein